MTAWALLSLALAAGPGAKSGGPAHNPQNPLSTRAKEKEELVTKLRRDIFKVDRAIGETERLIVRSRNAPYLPDLQFRLAELYVEKSRYVYYLQAESRPEGAKGALISPETKLYKQKALQIYNRILKEFPEFGDGDKVMFYLAHEHRELGEFDEMLKQLGELSRKYPQSPLRLEAEQIIGDHFFDKTDLGEAEKHYQLVLQGPASPVQDLARYKMGWIRINQNNHADAVTYFEAAAGSPPLPGVDTQKALNVKREALLDLVYSYTEARPPKGALAYFEKLSDSRATYALALDKLGNRYFIKQQYEFAIPALRRLMEIQPDPEMDLERSQKLYDALKAAKGKVNPEPEDVGFLVRAAVEIKVDAKRDEAARKKGLAELEEMARDLSTLLHLASQKKDDAPTYLKAAEAYRRYLSLFRPVQYVRTLMRNRADALFAAKSYPAAARQFEELAAYEERAHEMKGLDTALHGALLSHFSSLKQEEVSRLTAFEVADARQALKLVGARYLAKFPRSEYGLEVQFNIARAHYDDGEFEESGELFKAFALAHPEHKDASVAGHLALDSFRQRNDFKGLEATGRAFLAGNRLPQPFLAEVRKIITQSKADALGELALQSSQETGGDVMEGLIKVAEENKGAEIGEKALYGAFVAAREKRDLNKQRELGTKLLQEYPKSGYLQDVLLSLGRQLAEVARFSEAATQFETLGQRLNSLDGWQSAARLRLALQEYKEATRDFEAAADLGGARKAELLGQLAQARLKAKDLAGARAAAEAALRLDKQNAEAGAVVAEVIAKSSTAEKAETLIKVMTPISQGPNGQSEDGARGLWYLGEVLYRDFKKIPDNPIDPKVAGLQALEGVYTQAAQMGSPEWAVASLWRIASAYSALAESVERTAIPAGLSAAEQQQFKTAVKDQASQLKERAEGAFKACEARAVSLEVFTEAAVGCRTRSESPKSPLPSGRPSGSGSGSLASLQQKVESVGDAASLEGLGLAQLEAGQLALAQLTLGRATELEDNRAAAHNGLGIAALYLGDGMAARAAFGKALEADPAFEKARANLGSLRCRYGDAEGAKKELAQVKSSGLSGAQVDPDWRVCR